MNAILVKQGFRGNSCTLLLHLFIQNPCNDLVVGFENCVRENKLPLWGLWGKTPSRWAILATFSEKIALLTPFK